MKYLQSNPIIPVKDILSRSKYYNIAVQLLALNNEYSALRSLYGEHGAFILMTKIDSFYNIINNDRNINHLPIILSPDLKITDYHYQVTAMIRAGYTEIPYMIANIAAPDYGENWIQNYPKKDYLINKYNDILSKFIF